MLGIEIVFKIAESKPWYDGDSVIGRGRDEPTTNGAALVVDNKLGLRPVAVVSERRRGKKKSRTLRLRQKKTKVQKMS